MTATLNRPDKLNAIDSDLAGELLHAVGMAASNAEVHVLLLRGTGRAFCAGRDVGAPPTEQDLELVQAVAAALVAPAETRGRRSARLDDRCRIGVGARRGPGPRGGKQPLQVAEASLGVFVTGGLTATLPAFAGVSSAKALMLLGEEFGALQAHAWGLVWLVVADAVLDAGAMRLCERLARLAPHVVSRYKTVLNEIGLGNFRRAVDAETEAQRAIQDEGAVHRAVVLSSLLGTPAPGQIQPWRSRSPGTPSARVAAATWSCAPQCCRADALPRCRPTRCMAWGKK